MVNRLLDLAETVFSMSSWDVTPDTPQHEQDASRTLENYKAGIWGRGRFAARFGTTQRDWAVMPTDERRQQCREDM